MIDTKIVFLAQLQAKLWPFKDLGVPPGGQISNPRKNQNNDPDVDKPDWFKNY